jgi:uncharacterized membrane protein
MGNSPNQPPLQAEFIPPDKDQAPKNGKISQIAVSSATYSGPIPPPSMLAEYERICPGFAARIMTNAEDEAKHRRSLEAQVVNAQIEDRVSHRKESKRGQLCALFITLGALTAGAFTAYTGHEMAGSILGIGGIGGIVTTFILGRAKHDPSSAPPPSQVEAKGRRRKK